MNIKQGKHLKMEILQLHKIDTFSLLLLLLFAQVYGGKNADAYFSSLPILCISTAAKQSYLFCLIFQFSLFH